MHFSFKRLISGIIIVSFLATFFVANIETTKADVYLDNAKADKALLEAELAKLEKEIAEKEKELAGQKGQSVSLSRDIAILTSQIQKSKLDIKAKNLVIQKLGGEISNKNQEISALSVKIDREKESLAQLLRKERMINDRDIISLILSKDNISDVYGDIEAFSSIKKGIQESINEIRNMKDLTEAEKLALEKKKDEETDTKYELERDKAKVETSEAEKQRLLSISKNKEAEYQKVLQEKAQKRAQILAAIFSLAGGGSTKINFETALVYAREAQKLTGIDPAFLLAVLTQESNLGANVGQCYLTDTKTGAGMNPKTGKTYPNVMKPMGLPGRKGDIDDFFLITAAVGRDPYKTLVSCPIAGVAGYGGAMGPAQFIPSTWGGYKNRLKNLLGLDADPWNPRDAFMASATYLTDLGAVGNSASAQHKAACRYYGTGGTTCSYSNSVMRHKLTIQANIDLLQD